jgi:hypothetical protein
MIMYKQRIETIMMEEEEEEEEVELLVGYLVS